MTDAERWRALVALLNGKETIVGYVNRAKIPPLPSFPGEIVDVEVVTLPVYEWRFRRIGENDLDRAFGEEPRP